MSETAIAPTAQAAFLFWETDYERNLLDQLLIDFRLYRNAYVANGESTADLDLYAIMRAAGHIEQLLALSKSSQWLADSNSK